MLVVFMKIFTKNRNKSCNKTYSKLTMIRHRDQAVKTTATMVTVRIISLKKREQQQNKNINELIVKCMRFASIEGSVEWVILINPLSVASIRQGQCLRAHLVVSMKNFKIWMKILKNMSREKFSIRLMIQLIMSKGEDKIGRSGLFLEMKRMK